MPNLKTDRIAGMALGCAALNVRRLMYQSLIRLVDPRDQARGLRPALDSQQVQGTADPLVDGVRGNAELDGDFLRRQMLVDQQQAVELAAAQPADPLGDQGFAIVGRGSIRSANLFAARVFALHQHGWLFSANGTIKQNALVTSALNILCPHA